MRSIVIGWFGAVTTVGLMVLCLYGWQHASELAGQAGRPYVAKWAVRSGAIAIGAAAQVILLTLVVGRLYRRQLLDDVLRLTAASVIAVALVTSVALGMAAR